MGLSRTVLGLLAAMATSAGCACSPALTKGGAAVAKVLVSDEEETKIGEQVHEQLLQKDVKLVDDPEVLGYLEAITRPIFAQAKRDRPGITWTLNVIDDPKTVNAFSVPGGGLYVYTGLLQAAHDDAEVAGVLGHEVGHEVLRHVAQRLVAATGLEAVAKLALGDEPSLLERIVAALLGRGALLAFSRDEERQADDYGAQVVAAAGFNPYGIVTFFQTLQKKHGDMPGILKFLSDHPTTPDRIADVSRFIEEHHLPYTNQLPRDARLREIQSRLAASAVPGAPPPQQQQDR